MVHNKTASRYFPILGTFLVLTIVAIASIPATVLGYTAADCDYHVVQNPDDTPITAPVFGTITQAINDIKSKNENEPGYTVCVHDGTYRETVRIVDEEKKNNANDTFRELVNLKLIAYPDGNQTRPIISGEGVGLKELYTPLMKISVSGVLVQGLEITGAATGRGVVVGEYDFSGSDVEQQLHDVQLLDLHVHNNWGDGIVVVGGNMSAGDPKNIRIDSCHVYRNVLKDRWAPVIFRGQQVISGDSNAWEFKGSGLYDSSDVPFWQGRFYNNTETLENLTYVSAEDLDAISVDISSDGVQKQILLSVSRTFNYLRYIPKEYTAIDPATDIWFNAADILEYDLQSRKWRLFFNGDFVENKNPTCNEIDVDGFEVKNGQLLMSFDSSNCQELKLPGPNATEISAHRADLLIYTGGSADGTFAYLNRYDSLGFGLEEDLSDFAFTATGELVVTGRKIQTCRAKDLCVKRATGWEQYLTSELEYPDQGQSSKVAHFNPFGGATLWAVSIPQTPQPNSNVFISGRSEGGTGLSFTDAESVIATNNHVYWNYGEGLSTYFESRNVTLRGNVVYDNRHANLYLNDVQNVNVDSNLVYCTDDRRFWNMQASMGYKPTDGITIQDEPSYNANKPILIPSSDVTITNNFVVGCGNNFRAAKLQRTGETFDGLKVVHNTFVDARADKGTGYANISLKLSGDSTNYYVNSVFANNLVAQAATDCGHVESTAVNCMVSCPYSDTDGNKRCDDTKVRTFAGLTLSNNLWERYLPGNWNIETSPFSGDTLDPLFRNRVDTSSLVGGTVNPNWYKIQSGSPARNRGVSLSAIPVDHDYFNSQRDDGALDIGAHEFNPPTCSELGINGTNMALGDVLEDSFNRESKRCYDVYLSHSAYVLFDLEITRNKVGWLEIMVDQSKTDAAPLGGLLFQGLKAGHHTIVITAHRLSPPIIPFRLSYELAISSPLLISAAAANIKSGGEVAGIQFYSEDILAFSKLNNGEERWRMFFDGSDVGINRNVTNIAFNGRDELILGFAVNLRLPGVDEVTPWDIVIFDGKRYGTSTSGTFRWGLQGNSHGLTTYGERLDAIDGWVVGDNHYDVQCYGFPVSTIGTANVLTWGNIKLHKNNEDVFCKVYDGTWQPWVTWYDDVSWYKGSVEDNLIALAVNEESTEMLYVMHGTEELCSRIDHTEDGTDFCAAWQTVTQQDIVSQCYRFGCPGIVDIVWHGPDHGWNYNIDAIEWNSP